MLKELLYLEEEQDEAIAVLNETALEIDMDDVEYRKRLAAIIICYRKQINKITNENRQELGNV